MAPGVSKASTASIRPETTEARSTSSRTGIAWGLSATACGHRVSPNR
jgi:hypothetical protein